MTKRIPANIALQRYGMGGPLEYYEDVQLRCQRCLVTFTFSADEQQHWYETRQFTIDSYPTACAACRRFQRRLRGASAFLEQVGKGQIGADTASLGELAVIYAHLGRREDAAIALRRALKLKAAREERARLEQSVERASASPELVDRAVPALDRLRDHMLLRHVAIVVGDAYHQRTVHLPPTTRAVLERAHQTAVGSPGTLFLWKKALTRVTDDAYRHLQQRKGATPSDFLNDSSLYESLLTLMYQRLGNLRTGIAEAVREDDERLIDELYPIMKGAPLNADSSQQIIDAKYPVEITDWGGFLLPHWALGSAKR